VDKYIMYACADRLGKAQRAICFWSAFLPAEASSAPPTVDAATLLRTAAFASDFLSTRTPEAVQKATERIATRWVEDEAAAEAAAATASGGSGDEALLEKYTSEYRASKWPEGFAEKKIENHSKMSDGSTRIEAMLIVATEVCTISKANQRSINLAKKATGEDRSCQLVQVLQTLARANKRSSANTINIDISGGDDGNDPIEDAGLIVEKSGSESGSEYGGPTRKPKKTTPKPYLTGLGRGKRDPPDTSPPKSSRNATLPKGSEAPGIAESAAGLAELLLAMQAKLQAAEGERVQLAEQLAEAVAKAGTDSVRDSIKRNELVNKAKENASASADGADDRHGNHGRDRRRQDQDHAFSSRSPSRSPSPSQSRGRKDNRNARNEQGHRKKCKHRSRERRSPSFSQSQSPPSQARRRRNTHQSPASPNLVDRMRYQDVVLAKRGLDRSADRRRREREELIDRYEASHEFDKFAASRKRSRRR
jgi:hypothetical protein